MASSAVVELVYKNALYIVKSTGYNFVEYEALVPLVKCTIEAVEKASIDTKITGNDKLNIALRIIKEFFDNKKYALLEDGTLEQVINIIIAASKGQVDINNTVKVSVKTFRCIMQISKKYCCKK